MVGLGRQILEIRSEEFFTALKAEKAHSHTAFLDKMKQILRHFFSPHDPGQKFDLGVIDLEFNLDLGVGRADVRGFDEHAVHGDVLGKGHPGSLIDAEAYGKPFFESCDIPLAGHVCSPAS